MNDVTAETSKNPSSLKIRVLSGLILAPLTIAIIVAGGWYFITFLAVALLLSLREWVKLVQPVPHFVIPLIFGLVYFAISYASYFYLRFSFEQGAWLALSTMLSVWASDIGAYFVGRRFGGPKLAPRLSPKKTWSGFVGAMVCSGLALELLALVSRNFTDFMPTDLGLQSEDYLPLFILGAVLGCVGQAGDLLMSAFKRKAGIKDTGQLIPGHGGLLDRIDSLLLVSPVFLGLVLLWLA